MRTLKMLVLMSLVAAIAGCSSPRQEFVEAVHVASEVIVPDLIRYIGADREIPDEDRRTRLQSLHIFRQMVHEEKNRVDGDSEKE